jgi:hypothetical protein
MVIKPLPPHLIESNGQQVCSLCKEPFGSDVQPSLSFAFRKHVIGVHVLPKYAGRKGRQTVSAAIKRK